MTRGKRLARRAFLVGAAVTGGGLLVGTGVVAARLRAIDAYQLPPRDGGTSFGAWLSLGRDGTVEVVVPHQDMGQGIYALAVLLVAEGLKLSPDAVRAVSAPIAPHFANPVMMLDGMPFDPSDGGPVRGVALWTFDKILRVLGVQGTGGSTSTRNIAGPIRRTAAVTLDLLTRAAADHFHVASATLVVSGGTIATADGRRAGYGELAATAAALTPRDIAPAGWSPGRFVGVGMPRPDVPSKAAGSARYGIDVREPDQLHAAIRHAPRLGGTLTRARLPEALPGVVGLVEGPDYVAIVADSFARADAALDRADITWDERTGLRLSTADVFTAHRAALDGGTAYKPRWTLDTDGDATRVPAGATVASATYTAPFLAHAAMEPINVTARVTDTACDVWAGHQSSTLVQMLAAEAAELPQAAVTVHTPWLGGGFGRRADLAYIAKGVAIARRFSGKAVQTIWSRGEDFRDDVFRPAATVDVTAALDSSGLPATFRYRIATASVTDSFVRRLYPSSKGSMLADKTAVDGAAFHFYAWPNRSIEHVSVDLGVPVGFWRSVGYSLNCFCVESFVDELAEAAGLRPLDFRARLLGIAGNAGAQRARKLVDELARYDAQTPLPKGSSGARTGRGFAVTEAFGSFLGHAADVEITGTTIRVRRVFVVVDCGFAIDPPNVIAQVRGGVNFGLSAALGGRVEIENGRPVPQNFDAYPVLTLADAPEITVRVMNSGAAIGGVGEIGTPGIAPAVANAIFAATGQRLRALPFALTGA